MTLNEVLFVPIWFYAFLLAFVLVTLVFRKFWFGRAYKRIKQITVSLEGLRTILHQLGFSTSALEVLIAHRKHPARWDLVDDVLDIAVSIRLVLICTWVGATAPLYGMALTFYGMIGTMKQLSADESNRELLFTNVHVALWSSALALPLAIIAKSLHTFAVKDYNVRRRIHKELLMQVEPLLAEADHHKPSNNSEEMGDINDDDADYYEI